MTKEIILTTIHPIATDGISQKVIEDLQADGFLFQESHGSILMNLFIVGSTEGFAQLPSAINSVQKKAFKNVVLFTSPALDTKDIDGVNAFINFGDTKDIHEAIKLFLCHFSETIEIPSLIGYDFHSFMQIIEGHNSIETKTCGYTHDISEALKTLRATPIPQGSKCVLFFTQQETNAPHTLEVVNKYLESLPDTIAFNFSFNTSTHLYVSLLISKPIKKKGKGCIFEKLIRFFKK